MIFDWLAIIAGGSVAIGVFVYYFRDMLDGGMPIGGFIVGVFAGGAAGFATCVAILLADWGLSNLTHPETTYQNVPLASLQDSIQTTGSFYLGIGSLDNTPTYGFYTEKNGAYQFHTVDASDATLYQDSKKPYVVQDTGCKMTKLSWLLDCVDWNEDTYVSFHVPKGSIKSDYNLDAKN
jgi:hypothetical protein